MFLYFTAEVHGAVMVGFDPLINQRLLPPTFPRYTQIKSPTEAYKRLDELFCRLRQVAKVSSYTSFHAALVSIYLDYGGGALHLVLLEEVLKVLEF